jgi:DNA-binding NarL/FixJ family response regulator
MMKYRRVLLADSHQEMLGGVRDLLESTFDVVMMVADEKSLLDAAGMVEPDLAVVDLSMPCGSEENIMHAFKGLHPEIKIIILSCHDERMVVDECMAAGVSGFVLKRTAVRDLIPAVEAVMGGDEYVSPSVERE